jgi:hypothetical protein
LWRCLFYDLRRLVMRQLLLRRLVLLGVPLLLGILELGHPALLPGDRIVGTIGPIVTWCTTLHVLQVPLFALLGLAVIMLVREIDNQAATISRWAIAIFIVVYPALDAAVGISSGILCRAGASAELENGLQNLFWGPVTGFMAIVRSASWLVALVFASWPWRKHGAPVVVVVLLVMSGALLAVGHIRPFGPLACLCFLLAAVILELRYQAPPAIASP